MMFKPITTLIKIKKISFLQTNNLKNIMIFFSIKFRIIKIIKNKNTAVKIIKIN